MVEIKSEQEWLDFVQSNLNNPDAPVKNIHFSGWPRLEIIIEGSRYHGTLPTELMRGFVDFQDEFYRAYAKLRYKTDNLQRLSVDDRARLEFVFRIEDNCTKGTADESELLNTVIEHLEKIFSNMTGEEKLIGLAILVFSYAGYRLFEKYSDNGIKKKELGLEAKRIDANNQALGIQKQTIIEAIAASNKAPQNAIEFKHRTDHAFRQIFKGASDAESISIDSDHWDRDAIADVIQKPECSREKKEMTLPFYIEGIRRNRGYLTLNVVDDDDCSFPMRVESFMADADETAQLFDAFEHSREIEITFTAKIVDGKIKAGSFIELPK